jgi:SAM-dependent methyltransferase
MEKKESMDEEKICEKIIKRIYSELGLSEERFVFQREYLIPYKKAIYSRIDLAGFFREDRLNPHVIVEVKTGKIAIDLESKKIKDLLEITKAKYAILSNGEDFYFFENKLSTGGGIIALDSLNHELKSKRKSRITNEKIEEIVHVLKNIFNDSNKPTSDSTLQLLRVLALEKYLILTKGSKYLDYLQKIKENRQPHVKLKEIFYKFGDSYPEIRSIEEIVSREELFEKDSPLLQCFIYLSDIDFYSFKIEQWEYIIEKIVSAPDILGWKRHPPVSIKNDLSKLIKNLVQREKHSKIAEFSIFKNEILPKYAIEDKPNRDNKKNRFFSYGSSARVREINRLTNFILGIEEIREVEIEEGGFDLIFCMPPFGIMERHRNKEFNIETQDSAAHYMMECLEKLNPGGKLIILVPKKFLFSKSEKEIRRKILEEYNLKKIINLPRNALKFSLMGTGLLVIEKSKKEKEEYLAVRKVKSLKNPENESKEYPIKIKDIIEDDYELNIEKYDPDYLEEQRRYKVKFKTEKLSHLADIIPGKSYAPSQGQVEKDEGINCISIGDLFEDKVYLEESKKIPESSIKSGELLKKDDILFSVNGTIGKVGIFGGGEKSVPSRGLAVLRLREDLALPPNYFIKILQTKFVKNQIKILKKGEIIEFLTKKDLENISIPIIFLPNQEDNFKKSEAIDNELEKLKEKLNKLKRDKENLLKEFDEIGEG